ncbi:CHAT domain-containing protein [Roseivirga sp.]|uniref:CHAT domain-containing protein n=1 Tax=Roseivirga sp. TaxID=1964215 RepID=UPI002B26DFCB|nr:CHAT domain-containing protein [Roseivirga sp.]
MSPLTRCYSKATLLSWLFLISLCAPLGAQQSDFNKIKTPFVLKNSWVDQLNEKLKEDRQNPSSKNAKSLEYIQSVLPRLEEEKDYESLSYLLERNATILWSLRRDSLALVSATKSIETAKDHLPTNHFLLSRAYFRRGYIEHKIANFYAAGSDLDSAQAVYKSSNNYDSTFYHDLIEYKYYAYSYGEMNLDTLTKYLDERMEERLSKPKTNPDDILYLMNDYAKVYMQKGDYAQALAYAIEEVAYSKEKYDSVLKSRYIDSRFNLGNVLYRMKDFERGLRVCNELLDETENITKFFGVLSPSETQSVKGKIIGMKSLRAAILLGLRKYEESIKSLQEIINTNSGDSRFIIQQKINIANGLLSLEKYDEAKVLIESILTELRPTFPNKQAESLFGVAGSLYSELDKSDLSFDYYDSAVRNSIPEYYKSNILKFPEIKNQKITIDAMASLRDKARSLIRYYNQSLQDSLSVLLAASSYASNTHNLLMGSRQELMRTEGKLFLSENFKSLYEAGIEASYLMFNLGSKKIGFENASEFFRLSKAVLFLEQSGEFGKIQNSNVPQYLRSEFYQLKTEIESLNITFYSILDKSSPTSDSVGRINNRLLNASEKLKELKDSVSLFLVDQSDDDNLVFKNQQLDKTGRNKAIIEFFVGENQVFILGKSADKQVFERVNIDERFKKSFNDLIVEVGNRPQLADYENKLKAFNTNSYYIYSVLLKPIIDQFDGTINDLTIIPDEYLSRLPFETLITSKAENPRSFKNLHYLINDYTINYQLSSNRDFNKAIAKKAPKNLIGIGYSQGDSDSGFAALPGTDREIKFLQSKIEGDYYLGNEGSKSVFLKTAKDYDVLHLAIHGVADSTGKYESKLIFNGNDNILKTGDLYLAGLQARLAILSACESGVGEINRGEGAFSIARGFALVGVPSIVMSLWSVNDKVTSELMVNTHKLLNERMPINMAIAQTKRDYLQKSDNYTAHPYYWAAFISLGSPITIEDRNPIWMNVVIIGSIAALILLILMLWRKKKANQSPTFSLE